MIQSPQIYCRQQSYYQYSRLIFPTKKCLIHSFLQSNKSVFLFFREKHEFLLPEYMVHQGYNAGDESLPPSAQKVRRTPYGQQDKHSAFTRDANPTVSEMSHTEPGLKIFIIVILKEGFNWNQPGKVSFFSYQINYRIRPVQSTAF